MKKLSKEFKSGMRLSVVGTLVLVSGVSGGSGVMGIVLEPDVAILTIVLGLGMKAVGYAALLKWVISRFRKG